MLRVECEGSKTGCNWNRCIGSPNLGLGTNKEDDKILQASGRTIDYSGSIGHEGGAGRFDLGSESGLTDRKSHSRKRSSEEFQHAGLKFFESASSYFKSEEKQREGRAKEKSRIPDDSTSVLERIGTRRKLLDELCVAEAKVQEGSQKPMWEKQVEMIKSALHALDNDIS